MMHARLVERRGSRIRVGLALGSVAALGRRRLFRSGYAIAILLALGACDASVPAGPSASAPDVFGPWQSTPFAVPGDFAAAALAACQGPRLMPAGSRVVLADVRGTGRITFVIVGPRTDSGACTVVAAADGSFRVVDGGRSGDEQWANVAVAGNGIQVRAFGAVGGEPPTGLDGKSVFETYGRVGDQVRGVDIVLPDGSRVRGTTANGWFFAWWPGDLPTGAQALDDAGQPLGDLVPVN
jgi:hypothetical protein